MAIYIILIYILYKILAYFKLNFGYILSNIYYEDNINFSPNYLKKRTKFKEIKFVIIHYTGMQSEIESIKRLKNQNQKLVVII